MRNSARELQTKWGVRIQHGLYHRDGAWYHRLARFPAALFDPNGYFRFETKEEYLRHPKLAHGARLHVEGGISSIPGYVRMPGSDSRQPRCAPDKKKAEFISLDEMKAGAKYGEGRTRTVQMNLYERSRKARRHCIAYHGLACSVCDFDFKARFGPIGEGFIHIHHLRDLASIGAEYEVDPKSDLCPICPNCHAMIHRRSPPFSIEELRARITHTL